MQPYIERESGIDIARAIKIVRYHAKDYRIDENKIALVGFLAGGIANGRAVLEFGENVNGKSLDDKYVPNEIDNVSSIANAVIMGYSFYGKLSFADLNESMFKNFDLLPTYYVYGTKDPFYNQFECQVDLLHQLNKNIELQVLDNYPHGFGICRKWAENVNQWYK